MKWREQPEDRFDRLTDRSGECWLWLGYRMKNGYGMMSVGGRGNRMLVHRWAYERFTGPIPEGLTIDHLCRVRHCVNPAHLEAVTNQENSHRSPLTVTGKHIRTTHCPQGHEYTPENTYRWKNLRYCCACRKAHRDASHARERERRLVG